MEKKYKTMDDKIKRLIQTTTRKQKTEVSFYPRVINNTNIDFSEEELNLLNKGLKYNLAKKPKRWINNLAFEAETAITLLPQSEQDYTRHQVAKNLGRLYQQQRQQNTNNSSKEKREEKTISQIKAKLRKNRAIVSKADKGNSIVILYSDEYQQKVNDFIAHGNFTVMDTDITNTVQKRLRETINGCKQVIPKNEKWKFVNLNPTAPTMRGLIKVHKEGTPIRPIVNWKNSPGYKLAQLLTKLITSHTPLPYTYNVKNTTQLMKDLTEIPQGHCMKFASFDINNMYSNIPTSEITTILYEMCKKNDVEEKTTKDIMAIAQTIPSLN